MGQQRTAFVAGESTAEKRAHNGSGDRYRDPLGKKDILHVQCKGDLTGQGIGQVDIAVDGGHYRKKDDTGLQGHHRGSEQDQRPIGPVRARGQP